VPRAVQATSELRRILALPRRTWTPQAAEALAEELSLLLGDGTVRLRPVQAIALVELGQCRGLFAPIRVGGGKTLVSFLAARMVGAERPLLLIPGSMVEDTEYKIREAREHWHVPEFIRIMTYELLSQPQSGVQLDPDGRVLQWDALTRADPDLVVADEAHRLKDPGAAVTKRVRRFLKNKPSCVFAPMTGTPGELEDYAHLCGRALGPGAPVPHAMTQQQDWAAALKDESVGLGALELLGGHDLDSVRRAYQARLRSTLGVVCHDEPFRGVGLDIRPLPLDAPDAVEETLCRLRDTWELPDGAPLCEALELHRAIRQLSLGFFLRWEPTPPKAWMAARKEWHSACHHIVQTNRRGLDSPKPVIEAVDLGLYPDATEPLRVWREIRDTYEPTTVIEWIHPFAAEACAAWLGAPGICWTEHKDFARRISALSGAPYFAGQGLDDKGRFIASVKPGPILASIKGNSTGRNLQHKWNRNLITSPPNNETTEQLVGRTHREGQRKDVSVEWLRTCDEHEQWYGRALEGARYIEATLGLQQKLVSNG
jgi:hypothetical protein